jgi:hypothetical protein
MKHRLLVGFEIFALFYGATVFAKGNQCLFGFSNTWGGVFFFLGIVIMLWLLVELDLENQDHFKNWF